MGKLYMSSQVLNREHFLPLPYIVLLNIFARHYIQLEKSVNEKRMQLKTKYVS